MLLVCFESVRCAPGPHDDPAVEDAARFAVEDAVEVLVALAVRLGVHDGRVVIHVLVAAQHGEPVQDQVGPRPVEHRVDVVAHQRAAERDRGEDEPAVAALMRLRRRDVIAALALALLPAQLELGAVLQHDLGDRVGRARRRAGAASYASTTLTCAPRSTTIRRRGCAIGRAVPGGIRQVR